MESLTLCTKYKLNVNEKIISNNMKLFCIALDIGLNNYNSNGFSILDKNFKIPQHALIYTFAKAILDKQNKSMDDYKIILRACVKKGRKYFDMCMGYGEHHEIHESSNCSRIDVVNDFHIYINFNDNDDIVTVATDLNKTIVDNEPNINEICICLPQVFSSLMTQHIGTYYFKEDVSDTDPDITNLLQNSLFRVGLEFVSKNNDFECGCNYPNLSDVFENEEELYKLYDGIYPFSINKTLFVTDIINTSINDIRCISYNITEEVISISNNVFFRELLEKYGYTFEKFYKSMFPAEYSSENFIIEHYPEVYDVDSTTPETDINIKSLRHRCSGLITVPSNTKKIFLEINNYMKINNIKYIKIRK
jgi:hypothetical protein